MTIKEINRGEKELYNSVVQHPLQSWEWGEFRKNSGVEVVRVGFFAGTKLVDGLQLTFHRVPHTPWTVGYIPKGPMPDQSMLSVLREIGKNYNCIFIQFEPNILVSNKQFNNETMKQFVPSAHPLFTKYTFHIDLTKSEEELMKNMHPKTRYNIRVAQKHGVTVQEENTPEAFERYLELTEETTKRQGFYAHIPQYHRLMWKNLNHELTTQNSQLTTHLLTARYQEKILVTWILFLFKDVLYYPYGASASEHKDVMASNLMMWEAIRWGQAHGARLFDLWGTPGPDPKPTDPYFGFHRFKMGYGPKLVEFVGSYDLILKPLHYQLFILVDKLRWSILRLISKIKM